MAAQKVGTYLIGQGGNGQKRKVEDCDLGHHLTPAQLEILGKIDILLIPIAGGRYTITARETREVTKQVNPRIGIPEHYKSLISHQRKVCPPNF